MAKTGQSIRPYGTLGRFLPSNPSDESLGYCQTVPPGPCDPPVQSPPPHAGLSKWFLYFCGLPSGSLTMRNWSDLTSVRVCTIPLGQRTSILSARVAIPSPKWTRLSLLEL
jgi:hypothetical protein